MAMSGPSYTGKLLADFTGAGWIGISTPDLANAIGNGSMLEIIGKPFDTTDTGTTTGPGAGTGVGLTGIVGAAISTVIQTGLLGIAGFLTPDGITLADAVGNNLETEVALATLVTAHNPIAVGTAIITPGSIAVISASVASSIESSGITGGFLGTDWPTIADIVGNAIGDAFLVANSTITVTGSPNPPNNPYGPLPNLQSPAGVLA